VRIIELPACKMVTSGPLGEDPTAFERFHAWFAAYDQTRADQFYVRDFMWCSPDGNFEWGYAVTDIPEDTGGFGVIDFPGGLYAVAVSVDADGKDHNRVYSGIQKWVRKSGCFATAFTYGIFCGMTRRRMALPGAWLLRRCRKIPAAGRS